MYVEVKLNIGLARKAHHLYSYEPPLYITGSGGKHDYIMDIFMSA